jgi:protein ImuB
VVSLWLPTFATDRLARRWAKAAGRGSESAEGARGGRQGNFGPAPPLATVTGSQGGVRVAAANAAAEAAGVTPGLPLADARAREPRLRVAPADPAGDGRALEALADWCDRYTPWVAADGLAGASGAGLWLEVGGSAHLFGGERALLDDLIGRLRAFGFQARAAVADTPGAAWAVARFGTEADGDGALVPSGRNAEALAPLPVEGLRLAPPAAAGLRRLGLCRVGELLGLPRAPLAARFGAAVTRRLDEALGRAPEPISPRHPAPALRARIAFAEPVARREDLELAARRLIEDVCRRLADGHRGTRRLALALFRVDGTAQRLAVGTSRPARDPDHLERLLREKLDKADTGFGVETMLLSVLAADPLAPAQTEFAGGREAAGDAVAQLVDRLGNRLGEGRVARLEAHASHLPERACRTAPPFAPLPAPGAGAEAPAAPRPLHLLPWPEPIQAVAPIPDHPPLLFVWRRARHRVARAEGPERIGPEWWLAEAGSGAPGGPQVRDYYRVEDEDGRRFWVFREGLYRADAPPRWYLHGLFA